MYRTTPQGRVWLQPRSGEDASLRFGGGVISAITDTAHHSGWSRMSVLAVCSVLEDHEVVRGFDCQFRRKDGPQSGCPSICGSLPEWNRRSTMRGFMKTSRAQTGEGEEGQLRSVARLKSWKASVDWRVAWQHDFNTFSRLSMVTANSCSND